MNSHVVLRHDRVRPRRGRRSAFTMLELHVALAVMAVGLLGVGTLMIRQSKQVSRMERWCLSDPTYHLISQTDPWMRALGAPAGLETNPDVDPWTPPVSADRCCHVLLESLARSYGGSEMSATVKLYQPGQESSRWWVARAGWWQTHLPGE